MFRWLALCGIVALLLAGCATKQAGVKEGAASTAPAATAKTITDISVQEGSESIDVLVSGSDVLTFAASKQDFPLGVVLYFPKTSLGDVDTNSIPGNVLIDRVNATELADAQNESATRVEIRLMKNVPYDINQEGNALRVTLARPAMSSAAASEAAATSTGASQTAAVRAPATELVGVSATPTSMGVDVAIEADGEISEYDSFTVKNPARIVVDIYGVESPYQDEQLLPVNTDAIRRVRHFWDRNKLRVVLDTNEAYLDAFSATPTANGLMISVAGESSAPASSARAEAAPAGPSSTPVVLTNKPSWVNRIDFSSDEAGKSTIVIGTTIPVKFQMDQSDSRNLVLNLFNTNLPGYRQRPLITTRFESAVDRILPVQTKAMKGRTAVSFELREAVPYSVDQVDNLLYVHFEASTVPPRPLDVSNLPDWKLVFNRVARQSKKAPTATSTGSRTTASANVGEPKMPKVANARVETFLPSTTSSLGGKRRYSGEKIALDFFNTDIKNVFRILREVSGKNFAIDKDVTGKVTMTLDQPVPWDQVLELVLRMNQLGMVFEGDIIRIATLTTLKSEEALRQDAIAAAAKTKEQEKELAPLMTEYIAINYSNASADILPHLQNIISARGKLSVSEATNQVIMKDTVEKIAEARDLVRQLDRVTAQVLIEARVVEATTTFKREIGSQFSVGVGAGPINVSALDGTIDYSMATNFPASTDAQLGIDFVKISGTPFTLSAKIQALEEAGESKTISSPRVLTLDNKAATIKQGVSYPINKLDKDGNSTTEFKDIVLELTVTPHVTLDDRVSLDINITKNDLGALIGNDFSFTVNEARTELLVNDGDTIVIGGITKANETKGNKGVPGLSKIPILGWLFKTKSVDKTKNELLIFITPRIVRMDQR